MIKIALFKPKGKLLCLWSIDKKHFNFMQKVLFKFSIVVLFLSLFVSCCNSDDEFMNCHEIIDEDCVCTMQYDPVCGCNGITYGNACTAECNGITEYSSGTCE